MNTEPRQMGHPGDSRDTRRSLGAEGSKEPSRGEWGPVPGDCGGDGVPSTPAWLTSICHRTLILESPAFPHTSIDFNLKVRGAKEDN